MMLYRRPLVQGALPEIQVVDEITCENSSEGGLAISDEATFEIQEIEGNYSLGAPGDMNAIVLWTPPPEQEEKAKEAEEEGTPEQQACVLWEVHPG